MKSIKKYLVILVAIAIVALIILQLFHNKKQLDSELKAMQEYSLTVPVEVITPERQEATRRLEENGVVRSAAEIAILSETSGKVLSVEGHVGESVKAGKVLAVVEKEVLESQFRLAKVSLDNAEKDLNRFNQLAGGEAITQQQLEGAGLAYQNALTNYTSLKKQLENTVIKAPVDGVISKRSVEKGTYLMPSVEVFSLLGNNKMTFVVKVAENDVLLLSKGQQADIMIDVIPEAFSGNIQSIGVTPDQSGRYEVEIAFTGKEASLLPGMSGRAVFGHSLREEGLIIPRKCIVGSVRDASVFVLRGDSVISKPVKAISVDDTKVLITEGLSVNDKVVLSGQINLDNGSVVKVMNQ